MVLHNFTGVSLPLAAVSPNVNVLAINELNLVYDCKIDDKCELFGAHGDKLQLKDNVVSRLHDVPNGYNDIYGSESFTKGTHKWKMNILQRNGYMMMGFSDSTDYTNSFYWCQPGNDHIYYTFYEYAQKQSNVTGQWEKYGKTFNTGDSVTMELNLDDKTISYWINDDFLFIAFDKIVIPIANNGLRLAIGIYKQNDSISIEQYCMELWNNKSILSIENNLTSILASIDECTDKVNQCVNKISDNST